MLITGGAGMIGSTIAHQAVAQGAEVSILDAMLPLYGGNLFNLHGLVDPVRVSEGDSRVLDLMRRVVPGYDYIFSLAGQVSYVDSNTEPLTDLDINCKGHLQVLEACRRENPRARMGASNIIRWMKATRLIA
ncbi:MAG: NAD-dependent epimerase/dehydratase family protein [Syntrophobacterales bacterium]